MYSHKVPPELAPPVSQVPYMLPLLSNVTPAYGLPPSDAEEKLWRTEKVPEELYSQIVPLELVPPRLQVPYRLPLLSKDALLYKVLPSEAEVKACRTENVPEELYSQRVPPALAPPCQHVPYMLALLSNVTPAKGFPPSDAETKLCNTLKVPVELYFQSVP